MPKRYWYVILTYAIMQFSGIIVAPVLMMLFPEQYMEAAIYWTVFSFIAALFIIIALLKPDMEIRNHRDASSFGQVILWSILGVFMAYMAQALAVYVEWEIFQIRPGSENTMEIMDLARAIPFFVIVPAIIAPILEEIIFRKIIFGTFYKKMNFFLAAFLSALIFGFIHGEPEHILIYSSMGFVFAYLYIKTKRIITPIIVHAAMNTITVIGQYFLTPEQIEKQLEQFEQLQVIFIGGLL